MVRQTRSQTMVRPTGLAAENFDVAFNQTHERFVRAASTATQTNRRYFFWINSAGSLMTGRTVPAYRGRESDAGFCAELQEPAS